MQGVRWWKTIWQEERTAHVRNGKNLGSMREQVCSTAEHDAWLQLLHRYCWLTTPNSRTDERACTVEVAQEVHFRGDHWYSSRTRLTPVLRASSVKGGMG